MVLSTSDVLYMSFRRRAAFTRLSVAGAASGRSQWDKACRDVAGAF
ncbi:MAG: hypothetical protein ACREDV_06115 [Methylocella sp.]